MSNRWCADSYIITYYSESELSRKMRLVVNFFSMNGNISFEGPK